MNACRMNSRPWVAERGRGDDCGYTYELTVKTSYSLPMLWAPRTIATISESLIPGNAPHPRDAESNARLIATAPELLDACKQALRGDGLSVPVRQALAVAVERAESTENIYCVRCSEYPEPCWFHGQSQDDADKVNATNPLLVAARDMAECTNAKD